MKSSRETKKQIEYKDLNHDFIQRQKTVRLKSFVFLSKMKPSGRWWEIKDSKSSFWAYSQSYLGPPILKFLRKHPRAGKRKIRDTVSETKTQ